LHIYNVANVSDRDRVSSLSIVWSADGIKCALLINGYAHATFDFAAKQGRFRTNSPNSSNSAPGLPELLSSLVRHGDYMAEVSRWSMLVYSFLAGLGKSRR